MRQHRASIAVAGIVRPQLLPPRLAVAPVPIDRLYAHHERGDRSPSRLLRNQGRLGSVPVNMVLGQRGRPAAVFDTLLTHQADYQTRTRNKTSDPNADRSKLGSTLGRSFFMSNLQSVSGTVKSPIQHIIEDPTQQRTLPPIDGMKSVPANLKPPTRRMPSNDALNASLAAQLGKTDTIPAEVAGGTADEFAAPMHLQPAELAKRRESATRINKELQQMQ